jgi:hypothetical protein
MMVLSMGVAQAGVVVELSRASSELLDLICAEDVSAETLDDLNSISSWTSTKKLCSLIFSVFSHAMYLRRVGSVSQKI